MTKVARGILNDSKIVVNDELLVNLVAEDAETTKANVENFVKNFNDAKNGEVFGIYWVPEEAYAINSNLEFVVMDYFDHDTNQYIKKALVVNDGKILDPKYVYILKKSVEA